jgi:integrase
MVKLKFMLRRGEVYLCISGNKQRYYKSVRHLLVGNPNAEKHWNDKKERFSSHAANYAENNKILEDFKTIYRNLSLEHPEMDTWQVSDFYNDSRRTSRGSAHKKNAEDEPIASYDGTIDSYIRVVVRREEAKQGCNCEIYQKLLSKCRNVLPNFKWLTFEQLTYDRCIGIAGEFAKHGGYIATTKAFRAVLGRASKDKDVQFSITQIGEFKFSDYNPKKYETGIKRPDVLPAEQLKIFLNMDPKAATPSYRDRQAVELYHDFCVFMFHSFFAPCDVIKLKYKDITDRNTLQIRRKKTHHSVEVPISPIMANIISKYRGTTKDGYVFPIMDEQKQKKYKTREFLFKRFREKVSIWLKDVKEELGMEYRLYPYVFRHTAITVALDSGLPLAYVATVAGTSIKMIQEHYYNGDSPQNQQRLQMALLKAAL